MNYEEIKKNIRNKIIQKIIIEKIYNQSEFAKLIGVSKQSVSAWINQNACPDAARIPIIAEALHIKVSELLGIEDELTIKAKALELYDAFIKHPNDQGTILKILDLK